MHCEQLSWDYPYLKYSQVNKWVYFVQNNDILSEDLLGLDRSAVIQKMLSENKGFYAVFVDLKKAFDSVYRIGLCLKLFNLGVKCKMLRIFSG